MDKTDQELINLAAADLDRELSEDGRPLCILYERDSAYFALPETVEGERPREIPLEFAGWSRDDDHEDGTYQLGAYFGSHGQYLGPDKPGVHPTFRIG